MDKVKELIQQIRHYSQLRFAIFAVFLAITGGLLTVFFRSHKDEHFLLMLTGILFSIVFAYFQLKLGAIYSRCLEALKTEAMTNGEFVRLLFGETVNDPLVSMLETVKRWLAKRLPWEPVKKIVQHESLGPINLAIFLLHGLVIVVWLSIGSRC